MDNFSQEIEKNSEEKKMNQQSNGIDDIKFEEVLDIDVIQKKLQEELDKGTTDTDLDSSSASELFEISKAKQGEHEAKASNLPTRPSASDKTDANAKKYVIYIDSNNIEFMEGLTLNERREVINRILKEQNQLSIEQRKLNEKKRYLKHAILACFTFVVFFPLMFTLVNKSTEAVISNYQQSRQNITKLYREEGKIKMSRPGAVQNIKY